MKSAGRRNKPKLTHFDPDGSARMVDVSGKNDTAREAVAACRVRMLPETLKLILDQRISKGDVFGVARLAGIMAAKRTSDIIPLCHPIALTAVEISFIPEVKSSSVDITATARTTGKTGVEMEALAAVSVAGLTIYDMCKAVDRGMSINDIRLINKSGGKSGTYKRSDRS